MLNLIKLEWIKNKSNMTFWILLLIYIGATYVILSTGSILMNASYEFTSNQEIQDFPQITIYEFPGIWHNMSYIGSFVRLLLAVIIIFNISNEVTFRTLRQNIIDGLSPARFLVSKLILITALATIATIALFLISLYFGFQYSENQTELIFSKLSFVGAYFIEIFGYLCFAMAASFWIKKSVMSVMFVLAYSIIFEPFFGWVFLDGEGLLIQLLPINALDNLIQSPINLLNPEEVQTYISMTELNYAVAWILAFIGISYLLLTKRDW
ncbi:hypothetical protein SAMN04488028_101590 [Reichenbachiella agariperforans]|uniref:ABC-2 family transporter protein n=1 Tax=Reichenbachiella agariperforans TaxID=156994 RepID=A0A1M6KII0_REIAG|nr:ABC transporter permease subunit [Reichenbachiella agariperforans]SHJ58752.1 hypothetical protein SAMN04488028_101590 [Reichenbachiella agariperforans]